MNKPAEQPKKANGGHSTPTDIGEAVRDFDNVRVPPAVLVAAYGLSQQQAEDLGPNNQFRKSFLRSHGSDAPGVVKGYDPELDYRETD